MIQILNWKKYKDTYPNWAGNKVNWCSYCKKVITDTCNYVSLIPHSTEESDMCMDCVKELCDKLQQFNKKALTIVE